MRLNNRKTHIISFIFLTLIVFPQVSMMVLQMWQLKVQHEAAERMEKAALVTIMLDPADFTWENKREIRTQGKMFDVKTCSVQNGHYIFTGIFDEKETAIKDILKKGASTGLLIRLLVMVQGCLMILSAGFLIIALPAKNQFILLQDSIYSRSKELLTPPPRYSFA